MTETVAVIDKLKTWTEDGSMQWATNSISRLTGLRDATSLRGDVEVRLQKGRDGFEITVFDNNKTLITLDTEASAISAEIKSAVLELWNLGVQQTQTKFAAKLQAFVEGD